MSEIEPCGPERDAAIAREVFGWAFYPLDLYESTHPGCDYNRMEHWHDANGAVAAIRDKWSTDNHAALDLLMEMQRRGHSGRHFFGSDGTHVVGIMLFSGRWEDATGATFADAVSAAALRAVRAEAKEERA